MSQTVTFDVKGLWTNPNDISKVPAGSLRVARNIDLSKTGLISPRRGFDILRTLPVSTDRAKKLFFFNGKTLVHDGSLLKVDDGSFTSLGTLTAPALATNVRMAALQKNGYFTSSTGIRKLDSAAGTLYNAGVPKGLMLTAALDTGTGTAVAITKYVAYRYLIARKDANNNVVFGGVSDKFTIQNTDASLTKNIVTTIYIPSGLDTTYFIQLYRSASSSVSAINDELQLCYEKPLIASDITNGYLTITDIVTDDLLGSTLYIASSQEGIVNDNGSGPPLARDLAEYKGCLFYGDVESRYRYALTLVAVSGLGVVVGDTITLSDGTTTETYTAATTENASLKQFAVSTNTSLAIRINDTARSLVSVVNQKSALVYLYTVTDQTGLPGKLRFESRALGSSAFTVVSNRATAWSPQLQTTVSANQTATNDALKSGLMYSKYQQPEAVPTKNVFNVGSSDTRIMRIVALRDGLLIIKEDGIYILTGVNESNFSIQILDNTCKIIAPDSVLTLNNLIYGLFEGGVGEVSTSGVNYITNSVQDRLQALFGLALTATRKAFAFASQTEAKYYLCLPTNSTDTYSTQQLVYDVFSKSFVESGFLIGCGEVGPNGKIYMGMGDSNKIKVERKNFDYTDFADYEQASTATAYNSTTLTLTLSGSDAMTIGDILSQGVLQPAYIVATNPAAGTVTVDIDNPWNLALPIDHYKGIDIEIEWNREFGGNPAGFKHFSECIMLFKQTIIRGATLSFSSDVAPAFNMVPMNGPDSTFGWGYQPWDDGVWGGDQFPVPVRRGVPKPTARCNALSVKFAHRVAYSDFLLSGLSLLYNETSTKGSR